MHDDPSVRDPEPASAHAGAGLSSREAAERLRRDGPNVLPQPERRSRWRILREVLAEPMLLLLLSAVAVYVALGDPIEAALLAASVLLVIGLTFRNEQKSERALQALRKLASPPARVVRDGKLKQVPARELVVGDCIHLSEGDRVPADARLLEAIDLHTDESLLTGESAPVHLDVAAADIARRTARAGTLVVRGHGLAIISASGVHTEVGRIGVSLGTIKPGPTPMQLEIRRLVKLFVVLGAASCLVVTGAYAFTRGDWLHALLAGLTLAMANIPEEFPVILTVFLALGAWRMARRNALVRRTPAIEALGAISVLCVDKTGTLTENRMTVAARSVAGSNRGGAGATQPLLQVAARAGRADSWDPMEQALRNATRNTALAGYTHVREYPLTAARPAVAHAWRVMQGGALQVACKGAPETVVGLCGLGAETRNEALAAAAAMAQRGLRVLGVATAAWRDADGAPLPSSLDGFAWQWLGLVGFADPLRAGVREAVAEARAAGIRLIMLTGDHVATAHAIARQAGLIDDRGEVVAGGDLDQLGDDELAARLGDASVFARVRPEHKLRLVQALRRMGKVVAMTGDGVNDAPALLAAHVGVAMGGRGTDVAREAAAIVLLDDNFVTIVDAIGMGRRIHANIRRAVRYVLAVHVPITGLALLPLLTGSPLLLLPLHIVLVELIIDPACAIVFEREAPAADLMRRPPRAPDAPLLGLRGLIASLAHGVVMFAVVAVAYAIGVARALPTPELAALAFTALVAGNVALIILYRPGRTLWQTLRQPNTAFVAIVGLALTALTLMTRVDGVARWLNFSPPPLAAWLLVIALPVLVVALLKLVSGDARARCRSAQSLPPRPQRPA